MRIKFIVRLFYCSIVIFLLVVSLPALSGVEGLIVSKAHAQFPNPNTNYLNTNPDVPQNFHTYTQSILIELTAAISCQIIGVDPTDSNGKCLGIDSKTGKIGFVQGGGGLIGIAGNMIAMTFEIPISSTHYSTYLADNFGVTKKTYAQSTAGGQVGQTGDQEESSTGFTGLKPLLKLWQAFRNLTYLIFVIVFIIIGLGIMFRIKIDPRTVMTLQNQIPKIIIALVLVTLSYAIAGFLIDMMYVAMYLVFNTFAPLLTNTEKLNPTALQGSNPLDAVGALGGLRLASEAASGLGGIIGSLFDGTTARLIAALVVGLLGTGIGAVGFIPIGSIAGGLLGGALGFLGGSKILAVLGSAIAFIVIAVAVLSALFRLWFQLLKAYIFILINTVLAPFWIAAGLIPGSNINFSAWLRDMVGNLSSFPATLVMLLFGKIFVDAFGANPSPQNFVPPFVGNPGNQSSFGALIGLGIILLTPQVVTMVRSAIKAPETKILTAIGQSVGVGAGVVGAPFSFAARAGGQGLAFRLAEKLRESRLPFLGGGGGPAGGGPR